MGRGEILEDLFIINSITDSEGIYQCTIQLNPSHAIYKGHFPGQPVLPGVCMLFIIKSCITTALNSKVRFTSIRSCKFISVVDPEKSNNLIVSFRISGENKIEAFITREEETVLKLKAEIDKE